MSALYMLRNPTGYFALLIFAIARPVMVYVLVVRILYLACMKDSKMQAGSISMNVVEGIKVTLELSLPGYRLSGNLVLGSQRESCVLHCSDREEFIPHRIKLQREGSLLLPECRAKFFSSSEICQICPTPILEPGKDQYAEERTVKS
jgi:hypothetical protein